MQEVYFSIELNVLKQVDDIKKNVTKINKKNKKIVLYSFLYEIYVKENYLHDVKKICYIAFNIS